MGLTESAPAHAVTVGGQSIPKRGEGGLGGFAELEDSEAGALASAIRLAAFDLDGAGKPFVVTIDPSKGRPEGSVPLADVSWLLPYEPDRASLIRQTEPETLADRDAREWAEAEKAQADALAELNPPPVVPVDPAPPVAVPVAPVAVADIPVVIPDSPAPAPPPATPDVKE
jgi:hypothetical protein